MSAFVDGRCDACRKRFGARLRPGEALVCPHCGRRVGRAPEPQVIPLDSSKPHLRLAPAMRLAGRIAEALKPGCQRLQVAGSIRRRMPVVGDVEIVAIGTPQLDLYQQPTGRTDLDNVLDALEADGRLVKVKRGSRYAKYELPGAAAVGAAGFKLDLFMTTEQRWGVIYAIRTGPADFAAACVTPVSQGGRLADGLKVADGRLWRVHQPGPDVSTAGLQLVRGDWCSPIATPEERDYLAYAGGWWPPQNRRSNLHVKPSPEIPHG